MVNDIELNERDGRINRRASFKGMITRRTTNFATFRDGNTEDQASAKFPSLTDEEARRQDALLAFMVGDNLIKGSLAIVCLWYSRFMRHKFNSQWHLLAPALKGLESESLAPKKGDLVVVYNFLMTVALKLKTQSGLALAEIIDELDNQDQLKEQDDGERALHNQVVLAALGWLTMLFETASRPEADRLEIIKTTTGSCGRRNPLTTRKIWSYSQSFDHVDRSLDYLLGKFGDLIPGPKAPTSTERSESIDLSTEAISVQTLCFNTIHGIVGLNIELVSSLALHLELDSGKKTLKVFQYPSFCRMMASEGKNGLLSRLMNDNAAINCEDVNTPDVSASEYFKEILLTYRLLFGLDEKSWKSSSRILTTIEEQQAPCDTAIVWDPLLQTLCGKSATSEDAQLIYDDIDASDPAKTYPYAEFPFFGKRLLALQEFVKQHQPHNIRSLLNDRRDVAAWYTLWNNQILVAFATITIIFMFLSFIVQIWQVMLAKQQLEQGNQPVNH